MTRRLRRTALIVVAVLLTLYFVPQLPPVRRALLELATAQLARSGYSLTIGRSAGNPWHGLRLTGLEVTGPGTQATVQTLRASYMLPALLGGKLPLSVTTSGVRGTLDLRALGRQAPATPTPAPTPTAQPRIVPVLRQLDVSDIALTVKGVPSYKPPLQVRALELQGSGNAYTFRTSLAANRGVAALSGLVNLAPLRLEATVERADVALARPYFEGAKGGYLDGQLRFGNGTLEADLELHEGQVDLVGIDLTQVAGPLTWRDQRLTTTLTGQALGGPLRGSGSVDLQRQHWQADVEGNAKLSEALVWLGQERLSRAVVENTLAARGQAAVSLTVGGWQTFTLSGTAQGQGEILSEPLTDLDVDFGFATNTGTTTTATAQLGGKPLRFDLEPQGKGFTMRATGTDLPLYGFLGDVAVDLRSQAGRLTGTTDLTLTGNTLGRAVRLTTRATTDGERWRAQLSGRDARGARASGKVTFGGSTLRGEAVVSELELPGLATPVRLEVQTNGPLTELPLQLRLSGASGVHPAAGGVRAEADFSGQGKATFTEGKLTDIQGSFGPLELRGNLNDLSYSLAPTRLSGRAQGSVALTQGRLTRSNGALETTATLETEALQTSGVTLPDLNARVSFVGGDTPTVRLKDAKAGLDLALENGLLNGTFTGTQLGALGETFGLNGTLSGRPANLPRTLTLDLSGKTLGRGPGTTLRARGTGAQTQLSLRSAEGATLAGRTLGQALELRGNASLTERQAALSGKLGSLDVRVNAAPNASGRLTTQAQLGPEDAPFTADFLTSEQWTLAGDLPLADLAETFDLPLRGTLRADLRREDGRYTGEATLQGRAFGFPLEARASGRGETLELSAETTVLGQPLTVSGTALPETDARVRLGSYGTLTLRGSAPALRFRGSGEVPGFDRAGLSVAPQSWRLEGSLARGSARLTVGKSLLNAVRRSGGWALSARLEQPANLRGKPLTLSATLERTPQSPEGAVSGTLSLGRQPLRLSGSLRDLKLAGTLAAASLQPGLLGDLDLDLQADALTQRYALTSRWRGAQGQDALVLGASGIRGNLEGSLTGPGLDARISTASGSPTGRFEATRFPLERLPVRALANLGGHLNGTLNFGPGYGGTLRLTLPNAEVHLRGQNRALTLHARAARGSLKAAASGALLPSLDVNLEATSATAFTLSGSLTGRLSQPQLAARLTTSPQNLGNGQVAFPAQHLDLRATLQDGLNASVTGRDLALRLQNGRWQGQLELPLTLRGEPHRLSGSFAGALAQPTLKAVLTGPLLGGPLTLSRQGLGADLELTPKLGNLPEARLNLVLDATPDLAWRADLSGQARLPYRDLETGVRAQLRGQGANYSGNGTLEVAGEALKLELSGQGGNLQASAALGEVALAPFVPATGALSGRLRLTTTDGLRYFANLRAQGEAFSRPFDLALQADRNSGLRVNGSAAGTKLSLSGGLPLRRFDLTLANGAQPFDLTTFVSLGPQLAFQGAGAWRGEPLSLRGGFSTRNGRGTLRLALADAELETRLTKLQGARRVVAKLRAPSGLFGFGEKAQADAQVSLKGSSVTLGTLSARVGENVLELRGSVLPRISLRGQLVVPQQGVAPARTPIALRLTPLETGYLARLRQNSLELRSVLSPSFRPQRVRLEGTLQRRVGMRDLQLSSNLVWQEGRGFSGFSDLAATLNGETAATLRLTGAPESVSGLTGLRLQGSARYRDIPVVNLLATLSPEPWRDRRLRGRLELDAPAERLVASWPGEPLALTGRLDLSGSLNQPRVSGPLALRGALEAEGRLRADSQGGSVFLRGAGLDLSGAIDREGYRSALDIEALDLSAVLPQPTRQTAAHWTSRVSPTSSELSATVRATQTWGRTVALRLTDLDLRHASSSLRGQARYNGTLTAGLELDLDLADVSPAFEGRLSGPLGISADRSLRGALELSGLGPKAADWQLGGRLSAAGSLSDPALTLDLQGAGSARGRLEARLTPRQGRLTLRSDLEVAGTRSDLTLTRTRFGISAAGTLDYRAFTTRLDSEDGQLRLTGAERLEGWQGRYGSAGLSLRGPLRRLNPQLRGRLELSASETLKKIHGRLVDVEAGPVVIGNLALTQTDLPSGRGLSLRGERLEAEVGLGGSLPWRLSRLELTLPGDVTVSASGTGTRQGGTLAANLKAASLELPLTAAYTGRTLNVTSNGELPLGTLDLRAQLQNGRWQGGATLSEGPSTLLQSRLSGPYGNPELAGTLELARGANSVRGTFGVSRKTAALDASLSSPQLERPLRLEVSGWPLRLELGAQAQTLELALQDGNLVPTGSLTLAAGPTRLALRPATAGLNLRISVPAAPGLALRTTLPTRLSDFQTLLSGLELEGVAQTEGTLTLALRPTPSVSATALRWRTEAGTLTLNGAARTQNGVVGSFRGLWQGTEGAPLPWLREVRVPFALQAERGSYRLASQSDLGTLEAQFEAKERRARVQSNLTLGQGGVTSNLTYAPLTGPAGTLRLAALPVFQVGKDIATLNGTLELSPSGLSGSGALSLSGGEAGLAGQVGWARILPAAARQFFPQGGESLAAQVRLSRFDLGGLPPLETRLPYLSAPVSGIATLSGSQIVGQVVAPDLTVLETPLPTQLDFNGTFSRLETRATFGDSRLSVAFEREPGNSRLAGLLSLETFPLQILAEAATGASDVDASATGAARFDLSLSDLRASYVRLATERLTLENTADGTEDPPTEGDVSLRFENGSLYVERADFEGDGSWRAQGILTPEALDFTFSAQDADFTPLLRLVPQLAAFNIGARGSLELQAQGSAADPEITLTSPGLELSVAGARYEVKPTTASLEGGTFDLESDIVGVSPIGGELRLRGSGEIGLNPVRTRELELRFDGDATLPTIGAIGNLRGRLYPTASGWQLNGRGALGRPFTVTGALAPLDLRLRGQNLNIQAPRYFLDSSSADVNLAVRAEGGDFSVSGDVFVDTAQLTLERGETAQNADAPAQNVAGNEGDSTSSGTGAAEETQPLAGGSSDEGSDEPAPTTAAAISQIISRRPNPVLARVAFDDISLRAPRRIFFQSGFGDAELGFDVTLTGTAATPQLSGEATTLGGTISFSGQDFTLESATATFDPTQGVYPSLDLDAVASFDKNQALGNLAGNGYALIDPAGSSFEARLAITGSFERSPTGRRALNLEPVLSSNATLQQDSQTPRPLNETELLTLFTLGRLQLDAPIVGTNGLAETVATTALDTAVDLFLLSELQDALSDVIGLDLEIRTSALSSVLGPDPQEFGVSVKLGGYLSNNLFASVQVGRFDDPDQAYALTNEFSLRYTASPLELNFTGGVNFLEGSALSAVTDFSLGLSYALTSQLSLDALLATNDSGQETSIGFGVSFIW